MSYFLSLNFCDNYSKNWHEEIKFSNTYASRSLTDREKNYSATEKEALAIVFAVEHFRVYLLGRQFTLVTDHSALQWLQSVEPKGRIARWLMTLQEYSFTIKHRPGVSHGNADGLSRLPSTNENFSPQETLNCVTTMSPGYNLRQAQLRDSTLSKIIEVLAAGFPKPPYFVWAKDPALRVFWHMWNELYLCNGLLARKLPSDASLPRYAYVVPESLVPSVLYNIHNKPFSGHLGLRRTLQRAKERFFWPRMSARITDYINSCSTCAKTKLLAQIVRLLYNLLMLVNHLYSGLWITWALYLKLQEAIGICL